MKQIRLRWLILTSSLGLFGCVSDRIDIHATDHERIAPGARLSIQIFPRDEPNRRGLFDPGEVDSTPAADLNPENSSDDGSTDDDRRPESASPQTPMTQRARRDESTGLTPQHQEAGAADQPGPEPRERSGTEPTLAVDLDYRAALGGRDDKSFSAPHYVQYDGTRFDGPQHMRYEFEVQVASADLRIGARIHDRLSLDVMGGLSTSTSHLVAHAPGLRAGETSVGLGGNVGLRATYMPHRLVDLYAQGQVHVLGGLQQNHDATIITAGELGTNFHLSSHVSLFGGWRWMRYDESINRESDVITNLSGPTFGLYFRL